MKGTIFEKSRPGRSGFTLPAFDCKYERIPEQMLRGGPPLLPEVAEVDLVRHYTALSRESFGVDCGFYPLGSCTMKYNPKVGEDAAALSGFTDIHPLQPEDSAQGCLEALGTLGGYLCEITGMDAISLQPAAGAHGEFTGLSMIKAYLGATGHEEKKKVLIPDSAHGTNPASAVMAGFTVVGIPSAADGTVDLDALRGALGEDTAALMLTNPNTLGLFEKNIAAVAGMVHEAGGLLYYDGANLNAVMGITRPGDMGFDVMHLNLHKTFATPHGGGGPGSGPVACKSFLAPYLPGPVVDRTTEGFCLRQPGHSVGRVKAFNGNFLVCVRALAYLMTLGAAGVREAAENAVLNANYLLAKLRGTYDAPYGGRCMHEFVLSLEQLKKSTGIGATDIAKGLIDLGMHPPTVHFPLIVREAMMIEPTETESRETLDAAAEAMLRLYETARADPGALRAAPSGSPVGRPDEAAAARNPVLRG